VGSKQASSFLKKRSKKLLSVRSCGNATISRRARAKPINYCDGTTFGVARNGDGLRRKKARRHDEWGKFFGSIFFKKGTAGFLAGGLATKWIRVLWFFFAKKNQKLLSAQLNA
jgi:hypothetical protein